VALLQRFLRRSYKLSTVQQLKRGRDIFGCKWIAALAKTNRPRHVSAPAIHSAYCHLIEHTD
jgi:hypothetical protein